ncbi:hypothetical protein JCM8208_001946 [Rhodotorula glutinis]
MSNQQTADQDDRRPMYPVIDPSQGAASPFVVPLVTSDGRMPLTHLLPDEQRAKYRAEQEEEEEEEEEKGEPEEQGEEEEEEPKRALYPLLADPSSPNRRQLVCGLDGAPLMSRLSPKEQHAEWLKEQKDEGVEKSKKGQGKKAGGVGSSHE